MQGPGDGKGSASRCCRETTHSAVGQESWRVPLACAMACLGSCMPRPTSAMAKCMWHGWESPSEQDLQLARTQHPSCYQIRRKGGAVTLSVSWCSNPPVPA